MVSNNSFRIVEDTPPDSLRWVKQGITLPLNIQVGPPENNLPSSVSGLKEAFSCSTTLFSIKSC